MRLVAEAPVEHGKVFLAVCRSQVDEVGDVGEQGDVEVAQVGDVGHGGERAPEHEYRGGIVVDAEVLRQLVVGPLQECAANSEHRLASGLGNARCQCHGMFLGDSYVDELSACLLAAFGCPVPYARCAGSDGTHGAVGLHLCQQVGGGKFVVGLGGDGAEQFAGLGIEGCAPVPAFLVGLCRSIALALQRVDVHHRRVVGVLYPSEGIDECFEVVALVHIYVVQSHGAEEVVAARAVGASQFVEVPVESAVVFGDGHLVVVDHDDEVRAQFRRPVEAFEGFAAAERPVADDGNHVSSSPCQVASLGESAGKADGGGGVSDDEVVVSAFRGLAVSRDVVVVSGIKERLCPSRKHLVGIALVRNVEDNLVLGRLEHVVHGDGGFHHAQVRSAVTAVAAHLTDEQRAHFGRQGLHLLQRQPLDVGGGFYGFYNHLLGVNCWIRVQSYGQDAKAAIPVCRKYLPFFGISGHRRCPDTAGSGWDVC